jgi:hypothetical protein
VIIFSSSALKACSPFIFQLATTSRRRVVMLLSCSTRQNFVDEPRGVGAKFPHGPLLHLLRLRQTAVSRTLVRLFHKIA